MYMNSLIKEKKNAKNGKSMPEFSILTTGAITWFNVTRKSAKFTQLICVPKVFGPRKPKK
jgi:hypothetical protein